MFVGLTITTCSAALPSQWLTLMTTIGFMGESAEPGNANHRRDKSWERLTTWKKRKLLGHHKEVSPHSTSPLVSQQHINTLHLWCVLAGREGSLSLSLFLALINVIIHSHHRFSPHCHGHNAIHWTRLPRSDFNKVFCWKNIHYMAKSTWTPLLL